MAKTAQRSVNAISVKNLKMSYKDTKVLKGVSLTVKQGQILALLGPNGAGKTTAIKILSTLLLPEGGSATVNGFDVVRQAASVRANIGLTGQYAAVDEYLSGRENLQMIGRLYHLSGAEADRRSDELLEQFDLTKPGKKPVKHYSGGMRRRLDLAMSLIASPPIIFLDEPTTGLDPRSRLTMWRMIKRLADEGTTILLTTQYMEEADQLADNIVVLDHGKIIAEGTASELKSKVGADRLELVLVKKSDLAKAKQLLSGEQVEVDEANRGLSLSAKNGMKALRAALQQLDDAHITVETVTLRRPTLDDVFLSLTGHETADKVTSKGDKS